MATPNTTIQVTAFVTNTAGVAQPNCTPVTCTVTFPDYSTASYSLGSGITNAGSGNYTLTYVTKNIGFNREDWHFTNTDGSVAECMNITPVTF